MPLKDIKFNMNTKMERNLREIPEDFGEMKNSPKNLENFNIVVFLSQQIAFLLIF